MDTRVEGGPNHAAAAGTAPSPAGSPARTASAHTWTDSGRRAPAAARQPGRGMGGQGLLAEHARSGRVPWAPAGQAAALRHKAALKRNTAACGEAPSHACGTAAQQRARACIQAGRATGKPLHPGAAQQHARLEGLLGLSLPALVGVQRHRHLPTGRAGPQVVRKHGVYTTPRMSDRLRSQGSEARRKFACAATGAPQPLARPASPWTLT